MLAALGSGELKGLLERLLLFKGLGSEVSHDKEAKEVAVALVPRVSVSASEEKDRDVCGAERAIAVCCFVCM